MADNSKGIQLFHVCAFRDNTMNSAQQSVSTSKVLIA